MKSLYESLFDTNFEPTVDNTKVQPRSKKELKQIIADYIKKLKPRPGQEVDLNWIDISGVNDLGEIFIGTNYIPVIDAWKIDHVKDFSYMFAYNEYIVRSPLPVLQKKLSASCYERMFLNCTALKEPPTLPAKKLEPDCYHCMFLGCRSLEAAPELSAEDLAPGCYVAMFGGCTSLKGPPELPAMELTRWCYATMFCGCTSLEVAPKLPAKILAPHCYTHMFCDCSSLKVAPELPATELASRCYEEMFKNCSNLRAKAKVSTWVNLDRSTAQDMYKGCPCESK